MKTGRYGLVVVLLLVCMATSAAAQVNIGIGIGLPNVSIGINLPLYPELVPVPGYPVYYAPRVTANYFFYDGMYWVYADDNWYASAWYNGPWSYVERDVVPVFILRVPVRYYRQPPVYFRGWRANAPPRWGEHWGHDWSHRHRGWDRWNRSSAPAPAPLPVYQRRYSGDRYPRVEQQHEIRSQHYRYQPRNTAVRQHFKQQSEQRATAPGQRGKREDLPTRGTRPDDAQRQPPLHQGAPADGRAPQPHRGSDNMQRPAPVQPQQQRGREYHEQPAPANRGQEQRSPDRGESQQMRGQGQRQDEERGQGQRRDEERGHGQREERGRERN